MRPRPPVELAVCAASCGPGNLHLINGLFDAQRSRVPVVALAAHIPRAEIGTGYFQETHPQELFRECSVYAELVSVPEQLPRLLHIAMRTAIERRGVAVLVIPGEIFQDPAPRSSRVTAVRPAAPIIRPSDEEIGAAAEVLNAAGAVTILAGAGCEGAHDELLAVAGRLRAPVVHALRGKEFVEYDNPYDVGMTGLLGFASGYRAMEHCDALLMLGTDFPYAPFYPDAARSCGRHPRGEIGGGAGRRRARRQCPGHGPRPVAAAVRRPRRRHTWTRMSRTTGGPARGWTRSPSTAATGALCIRSSSPPRSTGWVPTTPSSSPTSAPRRCGPPGTCG